MNDRRLDVVVLPLDRWPFLHTSDRVPRFTNLSRENMGNFFLALDDRPQSSPVLARTGSAGSIHGSWHPTATRG